MPPPRPSRHRHRHRRSQPPSTMPPPASCSQLPISVFSPVGSPPPPPPRSSAITVHFHLISRSSSSRYRRLHAASLPDQSPLSPLTTPTIFRSAPNTSVSTPPFSRFALSPLPTSHSSSHTLKHNNSNTDPPPRLTTINVARRHHRSCGPNPRWIGSPLSLSPSRLGLGNFTHAQTHTSNKATTMNAARVSSTLHSPTNPRPTRRPRHYRPSSRSGRLLPRLITQIKITTVTDPSSTSPHLPLLELPEDSNSNNRRRPVAAVHLFSR